MRYELRRATPFINGMELIDNKSNKIYKLELNDLMNNEIDIDDDNIIFNTYHENDIKFKIKDIIYLIENYSNNKNKQYNFDEEYDFCLIKDNYSQFNKDLNKPKVILGRMFSKQNIVFSRLEEAIKSNSDDNYYICVGKRKNMLKHISDCYKNPDLDFFMIRAENKYYILKDDLKEISCKQTGYSPMFTKIENAFYRLIWESGKGDTIKKIPFKNAESLFIIETSEKKLSNICN